MNQKELHELISDNIRKYVDPMGRPHMNRIILNTGNTFTHEIIKSALGFLALERGFTILTECKLKNNKRPDLLLLNFDPAICVEVAVSENDISLNKKSNDYLGMKVLPLRVTEEMIELTERLKELIEKENII